MFEFTCFRSSHEKLLYRILLIPNPLNPLNTERDVLQNSVKSSVLIKVLNPHSSTKHKLPLKYFIRTIIWKSTSNT